MEKSIKRVESLVHATNSALAQMKLSLMFDDMGPEKKDNFRYNEDFHLPFGEKFLEGDDLQRCQKEFNLEASEMLAKIEKLFGSNELNRKNSQILHRIKEVNKKMKAPNMEQSEPGETYQSRQKLLSLISEEKYSPRVTSSKGSSGNKRAPPLGSGNKPSDKPRGNPQKADALSDTIKTPIKSKEELKCKILETQQIVDRGFQTARQLAHRVDSITKYEKKTPNLNRTSSETNLRNLERKLESTETINPVKCEKYAGKEKKKKRDRQDNVRVIDVKRKEPQRNKKSNLKVQRLPSVHIRGELQMQRVHNLEIFTAENSLPVKTNTAISFLSHEQLEKEKLEKIIEQVRKENCCCTERSTLGNYVECYHCGKLVRIRQTTVDPQKVDEILKMCNFNVFDPRIEEFVEKYGTVDTLNRWEKSQPSDSIQLDAPGTNHKPAHEYRAKEISGKVKTKSRQPKQMRNEKRFTLRDLSDQLYNKYRQEADTLEGNHLKLDSILQNLFRKVDESREVFENCHLLKNQKLDSGRVSNLTATKPVLVSFAGDSSRVLKKRKKSNRVEMKYLSRSKSPEIKMEWGYDPSFLTKSPEKERVCGGSSSLICINRSGTGESESKKEVQGRLVASSTHSSPTSTGREIRKQEDNKIAPAEISTWTSKNPNSSKWKNSRKQNVEKNLVSSRIIKPEDWTFGRSEAHTKSFTATVTERQGKTAEAAEAKEKEIEEENVPSDAPSTSLALEGRNPQVDPGNYRPLELENALSSTLPPAFRNEIPEKKTVVTLSREGINGGKMPSDASTERSENNYESDFESMTNEPEEHVDEWEDKDLETFPLVNKLSTITEVDSELEKKLGDEPKASKSRTLEQDSTTDIKQEGNSLASEVSFKSKREESTPQKTPEAALKCTPAELVTSLKDILSALQDQFARTESLAEKLTENQKTEPKENPESVFVFTEGGVPRHLEIPSFPDLVENLQSARKDNSRSSRGLMRPEGLSTERSKKPLDSLSDEGGSSLGEIIVSERRRRNSGKSESSSVSENSFLRVADERRSSRASSARREETNPLGFKLGVPSGECSYSEGEIPSENLPDMERFSIHSVGEVSH